MSLVVIPGTFDPITVGHEDIIARASALFDEVIVCIFVNCEKKTMYSLEERFEFLKKVAKSYDNVTADYSSKLLADYAKENKCTAIVKGARNSTDFDYEFALSNINRDFNPEVETVILPSRGEISHISSTMVKELIRYNKDFLPYVPKAIWDII